MFTPHNCAKFRSFSLEKSPKPPNLEAILMILKAVWLDKGVLIGAQDTLGIEWSREWSVDNDGEGLRGNEEVSSASK